MGLFDWVMPVTLETVRAHIHADRRLAFEVLTAFGGRMPDGASSRVLRDEQDGKLVEFTSVTPTLFGGNRTYRTVERVTTNPPAEIRFEGVKGPLTLLRDRFVLREAGGCTEFEYYSTAGLKGWLAGWLVTRLYVAPLLGRFMRSHTESMKQVIEDRASRSRVYPQQECAIGKPASRPGAS